MVTVQSISDYDKKHPTVLTIGTFDGVHIGHTTILERLLTSAKAQNLQSTVLTFFPHPRMVLQQDSTIKMLNTIAEKEEILGKTGLNCLLIEPFTKEFSRLTATEFVKDILVDKLHVKKIIIGYDHRFGRNRNADIHDLIAFGEQYGFEVEEIPAQEINDISVSSTKIRKALLAGEIEKANRYLGYSYMLTGTVTKGKKLGRQLNFPTANISIPEPYKLIPKNGVYTITATLNGTKVYGMMNIGVNPTVAGTQQTIEAHFFNVDKNLYNTTLQVQLIHRLRDEQKFSSVSALTAQLQEDALQAKKLLGIA